ncbi:phosphoribosyltransferase [Mesorhizobium sp. M7A.F.Ca.US.011.01.1.1]|uniref:phosphoribosyltransferase n=1 Tax=Mesorhizobium sp. M7A.F.Ca.US.011.01.1.1 TaxID=2496741 RepID=UPI000FCA5D4E|nr:phosphoribosyltransferase [Mesorhizobium sp. M7A.F.Ca.US.011.01.1.1]RUX28795.1 phosphoribosyltransferase [Mesorhizobium sp. M7A.F.Ca.US.011.01.1.1]
MFRDREDAGVKLGLELSRLQLHQPVVLALPRGGVPVAVEVAKALNAPLDLLIVRKVGAPGNAELAVAAIVDGDPGEIVLNREIVETYALDEDALRVLIANERPELERQRVVYRGKNKPMSIAGKTAIIVDDGATTGTTMKIAIHALKRRSPREIIVAVPVSPQETVADLAREADRVVCISQPGQFRALSYHYLRFPQLSDSDVVSAMDEAARSHTAGQHRTGRHAVSASSTTATKSMTRNNKEK